MQIFQKASQLQEAIQILRDEGKTIGFIPTMGALHDGHISLLNESKKKDDISVVSIFINPTQFNKREDFEKYPRIVDLDSEMLENEFCDFLFLPSVDEMYDNTILEIQPFDIGYLDTILEGTHRPGHYQGVVTIVEKLLLTVRPDRIYMGLKDYQQVKVIEKLIQEKKLGIELIGCPTLREPNGLAMSSRNMRLSEEGKVIAGQIYKCLYAIRDQKSKLSPKFAIEIAKKEFLDNYPFELEYLEIRNAKDLSEIDQNIWDQNTSYVVLIALRLEGIRLIDNLEF